MSNTKSKTPWAVSPKSNREVVSKNANTRNEARDWRNAQRNPDAYVIVDRRS